MPGRILMEQLHPTLTVPAGLPKLDYNATCAATQTFPENLRAATSSEGASDCVLLFAFARREGGHEGEPMPKTILLDELHLTVITPAGQSEPDYQAMLRTLRSKRFQTNLRSAVREVFRWRPALKKPRFRIDR